MEVRRSSRHVPEIKSGDTSPYTNGQCWCGGGSRLCLSRLSRLFWPLGPRDWSVTSLNCHHRPGTGRHDGTLVLLRLAIAGRRRALYTRFLKNDLAILASALQIPSDCAGPPPQPNGKTAHCTDRAVPLHALRPRVLQISRDRKLPVRSGTESTGGLSSFLWTRQKGSGQSVVPMLVGEEAESVLAAVPDKQSTLAVGSLIFEVYLRGPPTPNTVFEFRRLSPEAVASPGLPVTLLVAISRPLGFSIWCVYRPSLDRAARTTRTIAAAFHGEPRPGGLLVESSTRIPFLPIPRIGSSCWSGPGEGR
jgi:hypothetical protein